jgi:hypothetical protein
MKKAIVLMPITAQSPVPFLKVYDHKDIVYVTNKATGQIELLPAEKVTSFDHLMMAKGQMCDVISTMSSKEEINII